VVQKRAAKFSIVCSDQPRNGKTLVARLIADYLILCERETVILDLSPMLGGARRYFPVRARKIDLNETADQMVLFDRALVQPPHDSVIDLPAHLLDEFFHVMRSIGFSDAARSQGVELVIYFVLDRAIGSISTARRLREENKQERFIVVWNEAVMPPLRDATATGLLHELARDGQLIIPDLPPHVLLAIEEPGFSFNRFIMENLPSLPEPTRDRLKAFLSKIYQQLDRIEGDAALDAANRTPS